MVHPIATFPTISAKRFRNNKLRSMESFETLKRWGNNYPKLEKSQVRRLQKKFVWPSPLKQITSLRSLNDFCRLYHLETAHIWSWQGRKFCNRFHESWRPFSESRKVYRRSRVLALHFAGIFSIHQISVLLLRLVDPTALSRRHSLCSSKVPASEGMKES